MDKRYQVFLSSTFADLKDERKEVLSALQKAGYFVAGMELFPSDDDESWEVIKRVIDQSDYYVLVVGGRYGSIGSCGKSFTEMEHEYARKKGLPILPFLHGDPASLPNKHVESVHGEKLKLFIKNIEQLHTRRSWLTKHELATEVLASISQTVNLRPRVGWVRGDAAETNQVLIQRLEDLRTEHQGLREERDRLSERLKALDVDESEKRIAWGDDEVELAIRISHKNSDRSEDDVSFTTQWSRVFDLMAPQLIGWCSTFNATQRVASILAEEASRQVEENIELQFHGLTEESLSTIRNQFLALQLIFIEIENRGTGSDSPISLMYSVELWRLSERGLREHSHKHARRRDDDE